MTQTSSLQAWPRRWFTGICQYKARITWWEKMCIRQDSQDLLNMKSHHLRLQPWQLHMEMSTRRFVLEERAIRANNFIDCEILTAQLLYSFKITESAGNLPFRPVFLMCSSGFQAGKAKSLVLFIVVPAKRTSFGARIAKQQDETTKKCQNVLQMVRRLKIIAARKHHQTQTYPYHPPPESGFFPSFSHADFKMTCNQGTLWYVQPPVVSASGQTLAETSWTDWHRSDAVQVWLTDMIFWNLTQCQDRWQVVGYCTELVTSDRQLQWMVPAISQQRHRGIDMCQDALLWNADSWPGTDPWKALQSPQH